MSKKCGVVVLAGRANTGKSTLLNAMVGEKVSIVSKVPQTTRMQVRGILTEERGQIVFVDNPGFYLSREKLAKMLSGAACDIAGDVDVIMYVVDLHRRLGPEEKEIARVIKSLKKPVIMILNKRDLGDKYAGDYVEFWKNIAPEGEAPLKYYLPVSALTKKGVSEAVNLLFDLLPEHPLLYPEDMVSDLPRKLMAADIIREKIFALVFEEVPHSVAVMVEEIIERSEKLIYIDAVILVQRGGQKAIIIGKKADNLKKIGREARLELQKIFKKKIFLDLRVKVKENWPSDPVILKKIGLISF